MSVYANVSGRFEYHKNVWRMNKYETVIVKAKYISRFTRNLN